MRASALVALSAAALAVHAAPAAITTTANLPFATDTTFKADLPQEIPDLPGTNAGKSNANVLAQGFPLRVPRLPRGVTFRQADYGVNKNSTLVAFPLVENVEASPTSVAAAPVASGSSLAARSNAAHIPRGGFSQYHHFGEAANVAPSPVASVAPVAAAAEPSAVAGPPPVPELADSHADDSEDALESDASPPPPLTIGDLSKADANHLPVTPNFSSESNLIATGIHTVGGARYSTSYMSHDTLGSAFGTGGAPKLPASNDPGKDNTDGVKTDTKMMDNKMTHSLDRRVLAPASYITTSPPYRRAMQFARELVQSVRRGHTIQLDTDAVLPSRPDPTLNTSDPTVAEAVQRKKNVGLINLDSNAEPVPAAVSTAVPTTPQTDDVKPASSLKPPEMIKSPSKLKAAKMGATPGTGLASETGPTSLKADRNMDTAAVAPAVPVKAANTNGNTPAAAPGVPLKTTDSKLNTAQSDGSLKATNSKVDSAAADAEKKA